MSRGPLPSARVFSLLDHAAAKRELDRLAGLSGRQALELYIVAYISDPERSQRVLRSMTDEQIAEAQSLLETQCAGNARCQ
jgi:hypothetical protein